MLKISGYANKFSGRLMVQADYKILESSITFLKQFSEGIISPNINKLF